MKQSAVKRQEGIIHSGRVEELGLQAAFFFGRGGGGGGMMEDFRFAR